MALTALAIIMYVYLFIIFPIKILPVREGLGLSPTNADSEPLSSSAVAVSSTELSLLWTVLLTVLL